MHLAANKRVKMGLCHTRTMWFQKACIAIIVCGLFLSIHASSPDEDNDLDIEECIISKDDDCSLEDLNGRTLIQPGKDAKCIYGSPYKFEVFPGEGEHKTKLLIFFQGGGGCYDHTSQMAPGSCSRETMMPELFSKVAKPDRLRRNIGEDEGIFDRTHPSNPYAKWTIVHILYCTGDTHLGNADVVYAANTDKEEVVHQVGAVNVYTVLEWVVSNIPSPSELVVSGCSAGALAAQVFSGDIFDLYSGKIDPRRQAMIADSWAGAFPEGFIGKMVRDLKMCEYDDADWQACYEDDLDLQSIMNGHMDDWPESAFVWLQSEEDKTQQYFYAFISSFMSRLDGSGAIRRLDFLKANLGETWKDGRLLLEAGSDAGGSQLSPFHAQYVDLFTSYSERPNFILYHTGASNHCYLPYSRLFEFKNGEANSLSSFVGKFPIRAGEQATGFCEDTSESSICSPELINIFPEDVELQAGDDGAGHCLWPRFSILLAMIGVALCL